MTADARGGRSGPLRQLIGSLTDLLATAVGIGRTRLELLSVELREELARTAGLIVWGVVALLASACAVLFAGLGIIVIFWDTHRVLAAVMVFATFLALAIGAGLVLRSQLQSRPPFLQATLRELSRDEAALRGGPR